MAFGDAVGLIKNCLADPAQQVEKGDARIGIIVIGVVLGIDLFAHEREQLIEAAVVEGDAGQGHDHDTSIWCRPEATKVRSPLRSPDAILFPGSTGSTAMTWSTPSARSIAAKTSDG